MGKAGQIKRHLVGFLYQKWKKNPLISCLLEELSRKGWKLRSFCRSKGKLPARRRSVGSESDIIRGVFSKVGSLPLSSFCAFPCFLPQLSSLAVFLQSSIRAQRIAASPLQVLVLMSRPLSLSLCPGGGCGCWAAGLQLMVLILLTQGPPAHALCAPCISTSSPSPASALGHLSPFCKANRSPGKGSSSCSASWDFRHLLLAHTDTHTEAAFT